MMINFARSEPCPGDGDSDAGVPSPRRPCLSKRRRFTIESRSVLVGDNIRIHGVVCISNNSLYLSLFILMNICVVGENCEMFFLCINFNAALMRSSLLMVTGKLLAAPGSVVQLRQISGIW